MMTLLFLCLLFSCWCIGGVLLWLVGNPVGWELLPYGPAAWFCSAAHQSKVKNG